MRLASRFGRVNQIRRDRPLTREELMQVVPSVFGSDRHESRSDRYIWIPTITVLENLHREGFEPFFACQSRVRDQNRREHTKHMLRLRRTGQINRPQVPEIILLNSHDGSSSYQMLPGYFRAICTNGMVCGQSFGEIRVPHRGDVVSKVIEGAYDVLSGRQARCDGIAFVTATSTGGAGKCCADVPLWRRVSAGHRNADTDTSTL